MSYKDAIMIFSCFEAYTLVYHDTDKKLLVFVRPNGYELDPVKIVNYDK